MIYFVSGHLDLTEEEFETHYKNKLIESMNDESHYFVVGDARGCDLMAQQILIKIPDRVTVFHMFESPRNNLGFKSIGGFGSDEERDEAMTLKSDSDIAWVKPGRERSGTARNLLRRFFLTELKNTIISDIIREANEELKEANLSFLIKREGIIIKNITETLFKYM